MCLISIRSYSTGDPSQSAKPTPPSMQTPPPLLLQPAPPVTGRQTVEGNQRQEKSQGAEVMVRSCPELFLILFIWPRSRETIPAPSINVDGASEGLVIYWVCGLLPPPASSARLSKNWHYATALLLHPPPPLFLKCTIPAVF